MVKKAVLLLNMGGPNNLREVEVFLKNMFNDKNIITLKSDIFRSFIASMITLTRASSSKEIYKQLGGKSPIVDNTKKLVKKLQNELGDEYIVEFGMRYTPPYTIDSLKRLKYQIVDKLYVIPLYPQYSTTTTKSSIEDLKSAVDELNWDVDIKFIYRFYKNRFYNQSVINQIKKALNGKSSDEYEIIFSAHSLPKKIVKKGDTYEIEVKEHIDLLSNMLKDEGLEFKNIELGFQSKLGPVKWLEPSMEDLLKSKKGKKVLVYPISFIIDNSETDYELGIEYKELANETGLEDFIVAKAVNDDELFVKALKEILKEM